MGYEGVYENKFDMKKIRMRKRSTIMSISIHLGLECRGL